MWMGRIQVLLTENVKKTGDLQTCRQVLKPKPRQLRTTF
jgi:hypothetical protein